ncbi:hypothetical protein NQ023_07640 [Corynebacterium phoceense]|uniref:hypothetical protein n=1 Tax=Corynebacterium phoceense TaxID=1686286 RepID=UPI00211C4376|nr:hypothetical protein [Corynebacterium phoceense]MCQ9331315.1 hypothetical protein [Corynebacterium phoceense]MCQ9348338.1 hypothetical protein [Corynebacterium phoceense]
MPDSCPALCVEVVRPALRVVRLPALKATGARPWRTRYALSSVMTVPRTASRSGRVARYPVAVEDSACEDSPAKDGSFIWENSPLTCAITAATTSSTTLACAGDATPTVSVAASAAAARAGGVRIKVSPR